MNKIASIFLKSIASLTLLFSAATAGISQTTVTFTFTGAPQNFVVPPCVTSLTIVAEGAQGGNSIDGAGSTGSAGTSILGGEGAVVTATIPVNPGDIIGITVGGQGGIGTAGYNGGGTGNFSTDGQLVNGSAGGGGSTNINLNGSPIIIAAGGGGGGGGSWSFSAENNGGGDGGCATGQAGPGSPWIGVGGGGGTQSAGGVGGAPWAGVPTGGYSGSLGMGGQGGIWGSAPGGGGGGGYFGGGGGGNDGCCTGANGAAGGGGGSSLVPGGAGCVQGANTGNGVVTITYTSSNPVMTSANAATICSGTAVNIPLTATMPSNFTWVAAANPNVTGESTTVQNTATLNNTLTNTTTVPQVVVYTVTPTANPGGCVGTPQTVNVTVNPAPTMTSSNAQTICSGTAVNIPLTSNTAGSTFSWIATANPNVTGESTTAQATGTINNTLTNTTNLVETVTYTVTPTGPAPSLCPGTPQIVTVTVNPTPSLTDPTDQLLCANTMTTAVNFAGPVPGTTYDWTNNLPSIGLAANGSGNIPAFNATNVGTTQVVATITVTPTANTCVGPSQTFTYTINPIPTVSDPTDQLICAGTNTAAVNFVGTVAGTTFDWTNNQTSIGLGGAGSGNIAAFTSTNVGVVPVVATVTVTPTASTCVGTPQTFTYTVNPNLVAGADNSSTICNSAGSTIDLDGLLSGNNTTGTWAETSASGQFTPGTGIFDGSGLAAGNYTFTYTVTGMAPCPNDVANFTISVTDLPNAGADNSSTQCNSAGTTLDLNSLLSGADPGGTWAETTGVPSGQFNAGTGLFTVGGVPAGVYTFTYTLAPVGPCPGDQAVMTITVNQEALAGLDNNAYVLCNLPGSLFDINTTLSGNNQVGTWLETTAIPSGQFNAGTGIFDASGLNPGLFTFTYTVTGVAPCLTDVADITLTVQQNAQAGLDNNASLCNAPGVSLDLNTLVSGNNAPGNWAETTGSGQFNAATGVFDASGLPAGNYTFTYTVVATPPCVNDVADFTVTVEQEALAGLDNSASLCNIAGTTIDLNSLLSGNNQTGTWAETTTSGQFTAGTGIFDASGLAAGVYNFTYTIAAVAPCVPDVANFSVTVEQEAMAGADGSSSICNAPGNTIDLDGLLAGNNAVGTWAETSASGQFTAGTGVLNASGLNAGNYTFTYTVGAVAPCLPDVANFTITVEQEAIAGNDNSASLCNSVGTTLDLNSLVSGNNAPGTWAETTASGQFNAATGVLNASGVPAGNYTFTYTVPAVAPCTPDVADFTVTIQQEVTAGADNSATLCNTAGNTINLNTLLSGNDPGGTWAETSASGQFNSGTSLLDASGLPAGAYNFTYTVAAVAPCVLDIANFTVNINAIPVINAGIDQAVCEGTMITLSGAGAGAGTYVWTGGITNSTPFNQPVGTTTYNVTGTDGNGCSNTDNVDVTVNPMPVVSFNADSLVGCAPFMTTFNNLTIPAGNNCVWDFGNGTAVGCGSVSNTFMNAGTYNVTLTVTTLEGCTASTTYNNYISVFAYPEANFSFAPQEVFVEDTEVEFTNSSLYADGYEWTFGDGSPTGLQTDPTHLYPNIGNVSYTVTLIASNNAGCADTVSAIVTVQDIIIFYVPNVFTPDGDDVNNTFLPVFTSGYDIYDFHLTIFNRWGEVMFESYDASVGWTGNYGDQGLVEDGVYIWQVEFGDNRSDKRHKHRGHVTVLK